MGYDVGLEQEVGRVPKVSIIIWGCITSNGVGTLCMTEENTNAVHYIKKLDDNLWPVMLKECSNSCSVHTAHIMREGNIQDNALAGEKFRFKHY